jgi:hypothetical protein
MVCHRAQWCDAGAAGDEEHVCAGEIVRHDERPDRTFYLDQDSGIQVRQVRTGLTRIVDGNEHFELARFACPLW